jgi:hypothetical protein
MNRQFKIGNGNGDVIKIKKKIKKFLVINSEVTLPKSQKTRGGLNNNNNNNSILYFNELYQQKNGQLQIQHKQTK